jgi:phosphoserine aminotransferase
MRFPSEGGDRRGRPRRQRGSVLRASPAVARARPGAGATDRRGDPWTDIVIPPSSSPRTVASAAARAGSDAAVAELARSGRSRPRDLAPPAPGPRRGPRPARGHARCSAPDGYEVLVTVGGATAFWDSAVFGLIEAAVPALRLRRVQREVRERRAPAPWLGEPVVVEADRERGRPVAAPADVDVHAWTHNETSTGVMQDVRRLDDALVVVDATSAAGGLPVDLAEVDVYYFSLQKGFAADGGLTVAIVSPRAIERIERIAASGRYIPAFLDLATVVENSRKDQTYNTPAVATVVLARVQVEAHARGARRPHGVVAAQRRKADHLYGWAEPDPGRAVRRGPRRAPSSSRRSTSIGVEADDVNAVLRRTASSTRSPYRKLGRNQLRIGIFPAVPGRDLEAFTACVDHVVERLA